VCIVYDHHHQAIAVHLARIDRQYTDAAVAGRKISGKAREHNPTGRSGPMMWAARCGRRSLCGKVKFAVVEQRKLDLIAESANVRLREKQCGRALPWGRAATLF